MADDADLAAIRAFVAQGGRLEVDKKGNVVAPIETQPDAADEAEPDADAPTPDAPTPTTPPQRPAPAPKPAAKPSKTWIGRFLNAVHDWAENLPTPGGNLALVLILVFFAFAVIPVNGGNTRLQLIWLVLTGQYGLQASGSGNQSAAQINAAGNAVVAGGNIAGGIASGISSALGNLPSLGTLVPSGAGPGATSDGYDATALLESPRGGY